MINNKLSTSQRENKILRNICICELESGVKTGRAKNIKTCMACGHSWRTLKPTKDELEKIYAENYYESWSDSHTNDSYWELKRALAKKMLRELEPIKGPCRILDVGCATGAFLTVIKDNGCIPVGVDVNSYAVQKARKLVPNVEIYKGTIETIFKKKKKFHAILFSDVLEHVINPKKDLEIAFEILFPSGILIILTPDINSYSACLMRKRWFHFKQEHLNYFSRLSLKLILDKTGFKVQRIGSITKPLTIEYAANQLKSYHVSVLTPVFIAAEKIFPKQLRRIIFNVPMGEMLAVAKK